MATFFYFTKLFGHSGSSKKQKKQALLPKFAVNEPIVAKSDVINPMILPSF